MIYNIIAIFVSLTVPSFVLIKPIKEKKKPKECKFEICAYALMVFGFLLRLVAIDVFPNALNVDEASSGYEAYSILNFGIDRNGNSYPVFLEAWGSGQNALLTYLIIPFIAFFGLSVLTTRLPMAIIGCISIVAMYFLLKNIFYNSSKNSTEKTYLDEKENRKFILLGLAFFIICPWHIMKTRWALESNLFPDMVLFSTLLIILSIKKKKDYLMYLAFAILGLTSYAYGTSYFFLPIYISILIIYLFIKKQITLKNALISIAISIIIALPVVIYVVINTFDLPEVNIFGIFTVPKLIVNRYEQVTGIFGGNIIANCIINFKNSILMLLIQFDGLPWNQIKGIGITYLISLPFTIFGIYKSIKKYKENIFNIIMNIWGISAFLLLFVCEANINRVNIIIIPIIYYTIIGIYEYFKLSEEISYLRYSKSATIILYIVLFIFFIGAYVTTDYNEMPTFNNNVEEMIEYVANDNSEEVYALYSFKEPYIYFLYYLQYNPWDFINTREFINEGGTFDNIKKFGKYNFFIEYSEKEAIEEKRKEKNTDIVVEKRAPIDFEGNRIELERFYIYKD